MKAKDLSPQQKDAYSKLQIDRLVEAGYLKYEMRNGQEFVVCTDQGAEIARQALAENPIIDEGILDLSEDEIAES